MKKSFIVFLTLSLLYCSAFATGFEETNKFKADSVSNIEILLLQENLSVTTWNENEICVISETNDNSLFPTINYKNGNLQIINKNSYDKENYCNISLMLPEKFIADKIKLKTPYGKLNIKKLSAKSVILEPGPDNLMENITAESFEIPNPDEADMNISNLNCDYVNITLTAGSVNLTMNKIPEKDSKISTKQGTLNISLPENEAFSINAKSFNSKFINNFESSIVDWIREGVEYKHNGGGVKINLQTHTGDIIIGNNK